MNMLIASPSLQPLATAFPQVRCRFLVKPQLSTLG
jgi:hypothetical protein